MTDESESPPRCDIVPLFVSTWESIAIARGEIIELLQDDRRAMKDEIERLTRELDEARAEVGRLRAALNRAEKTMSSVTVFVTSRQRINKSAGELWWREELQAIRAALASGAHHE